MYFNRFYCRYYFGLLGGNQRDLARQKNAKKQAEQNKGKRTDNLTVDQRKQRYYL